MNPLISGWRLFTRAPLWLQRFCLRSLGWLHYQLDRRHVREWERMVSWSGLGLDPRRTVRAMYANIWRIPEEISRYGNNSWEENSRCFTGQEELKNYLGEQFPSGRVIFVTAHLGNWELLSRFVSRVIGVPVLSIYKPHSHPWVNQFICHLRSDDIQQMVEKEGALVASMRQLKKKGSVGMLVDQHAGPTGTPSMFLGRECRSWDFAVRLSQSTGCPIVPVGCVREGERFKILWNEAIVLSKTADASLRIAEATRAVDDALSAMVGKYPEQWLWSGRRWGRKFDSPQG